MKSESPNNPMSPDRHPNLHGNPNAAPRCIKPHPAGTKVRPAEGIARCDDSLPYGLPPRPNIQTSLFRNGKPHIWTLQRHF
jgi:hypothetical protein